MVMPTVIRRMLGRCRSNGVLPDPACTPGAYSGDGWRAVCQPGYASRHRRVSAATKLLVYHSYGILTHQILSKLPILGKTVPGQYEIDHLIPLELGGSNAIDNLWPEPAPEYHIKDGVETALHNRVCSQHGGLIKAQNDIATDWTIALK